MTTVLAVKGLRVELPDGVAVVDDVSFSVDMGEVIGIVGESGSGKTTTGLALLGYARSPLKIAAGSIVVGGESMVGRTVREVQRLRGQLISYLPQDPASSLNPALLVETQVRNVLNAHPDRRDSSLSVAELFELVQLPSHREFLRRFPHQLSGGQQQRVALALSLAGGPTVAVLDEPTTGLDVTTQSRVLAQIHRLRKEAGLSLVYISHDLAVVGSLADHIMVMYAGHVVENAPAFDVLTRPRHPYTRGLIDSVPDHASPRRLRGIPGTALGPHEREGGCRFAPRCPQVVAECLEGVPPLIQIKEGHLVRCIEWERTPEGRTPPSLASWVSGRPASTAAIEVRNLSAEYGAKTAVDGVSFTVVPGECLAIVGESGSGKTTIARCIAGLHRPSGGQILLSGSPLAGLAKGRPREDRRRVQLIFQNPRDSLNPRHRVREAISRPARILRRLSPHESIKRAEELLDWVRLPRDLGGSYPAELSGGELQRVAIARALAAEPEVLLCDEITSALDVSVQAAILDLVAELQSSLSLTVVLITHDLGIVASVAKDVVVLHEGRVCELAGADVVLKKPRDPYTKSLLEAAPSLTLLMRRRVFGKTPSTPVHET